MELFNRVLWRLQTNYSISLPEGLFTSILKDFCKSRMSVLGNHEMAGQRGCQILPDDLDKCIGLMTILINQRINLAKSKQEMVKKQVELIKAELSVPVDFDVKKEDEPSILEEIIKFKEKLFSINQRRSP